MRAFNAFVVLCTLVVVSVSALPVRLPLSLEDVVELTPDRHLNPLRSWVK